MNTVYQRLCSLRAACGDPRDRLDLPGAGGPLAAIRCGIGPSSSSSATQQSATNQQVAVSGGGTAVGAKTANISKTGSGSATLVGSPGATAIVVGAKGSLSVSNQTNSNNRTISNVSNVSTINNSGTNTTNYSYGDDALAKSALDAVTHQGDQFGDAIHSLSDTVTHAISAFLAPATPAAAPVVYVTSPASPALTTDQGSIAPAGMGDNGLTKNEMLAIVVAVVVIGAAIVWHANK
jgi:hypothetical protein